MSPRECVVVPKPSKRLQSSPAGFTMAGSNARKTLKFFNPGSVQFQLLAPWGADLRRAGAACSECAAASDQAPQDCREPVNKSPWPSRDRPLGSTVAEDHARPMRLGGQA
jgi:hypothetical protein